MRKRIISTNKLAPPDDAWLDLEAIAEVEINSEDIAYPIESALIPDQSAGWRASESGHQVIYLKFATPQKLTRIWLCFAEPNAERTQEFRIRCSSDNGQSFQEVVRQQWNFSPLGATNEIEDYSVEFSAMTDFELSINPDINNQKAFASLAQLRLA